MNQSNDRLRLFVASAPGLEPLLREELAVLGIEEATAVPGGVSCFGDLEDVYRINCGCGLGLRVLVRVAEFFARDFRTLERVVGSLAWERWLHAERGVRVRAHSQRSRLYHTKAIVERIERGIRVRTADAHVLRGDDRAEGPGGGELGEGGAEPTLVQVRFVRDRCTISVDTTGTLLHKRGWREQTAKAPLREDIARALLTVSGWRPGMAVIDPCAGAGTLVIEAARWAAGCSPGGDRRFVCMGAPGFDRAAFERVRATLDLDCRVGQALGASFLARDRNAGAVAATVANAERAGVAEALTCIEAPLGELELPVLRCPDGAALVCNPPWGKRTGDLGRLRNLYATLGKFARAAHAQLGDLAGPGQPRPMLRIGLVTSDPGLAHATGLGLERRLTTDHGGIKVGLWSGVLEG